VQSHRAECPSCAGTIRLSFYGGAPLPVDAFSQAASVRRTDTGAPQSPPDPVDVPNVRPGSIRGGA
jgi:hypothetical protein